MPPHSPRSLTLRPLLTASLIALCLAGATFAAPAPLPRRDGAADLLSLWAQAHADLRAAKKLRAEANENSDELSPTEYIMRVRKSRDLIRQAAEKFTRVAGSPSAPPGRRELAALAAGAAWMQVTEYRRALALFEEVLRTSDVPSSRAQALEGVAQCHRSLKQADERKRLQQERNALLWGR